MCVVTWAGKPVHVVGGADGIEQFGS